MFVTYAIEEAERVDATPAAWACDAGKSSAPFPTAAVTAAETSFSAAQRLTEKKSKVIPGTMFQGVQVIQ